MKTLHRLLLVAILVAAGAAAVWGDTIEMKDGRVIQGKFLGATQNNIRFEVDGKIQFVPVADVLTITFAETTKAAPPSKAAPPAKSPAAEAAPSRAPGKGAAQSRTQTVTVPAGTRLLVRMIDGVDSAENKVGDKFRASLEEDLVVDGIAVVPLNSDVFGRLAEVKEAGRLTGKSELKLELTEVVIQGQSYPLTSGEYEVSGKSRGGDTAKKVGIGAAVGAVIGGIAAGGKGAAIGAGVGAGAGTTIQILTKGEQVKVPSETMLEFTLEQPLTVRVAAQPARR